MERLGFHSEASFCYDMSCYMKACDDRGSTPDDRMGMMLPLFNFIRELVMVPRFPLYGAQTVLGLNFHLAEDILCSIQPLSNGTKNRYFEIAFLVTTITW